MKPTEQNIPVVLFIILYCSQGSSYFWICGVTIQMEATEQYFPVVLFIIMHKAVLTLESVDELLKYDRSNEFKATEQHFVSCGAVYCAV